MTARKGFIREATGLIRSYGLLDATLINIGPIVPISFFTFAIGGGLYAFPGADLTIMLVIATILTIFWGLCYGLFASIMPRGGSEYMYISRLSPAVGFGENFAFTVLRAAFAVGGSVFASLTFGFSAYFDVYGRMIGNSGLVTFGRQVTSGNIAFAVGFMLVALIWLVAIAPPRVTSWAIRLIFVIGSISFVIPFIAFATVSHAQYVALFDKFGTQYYGSGVTYQSLINLAKTNGEGSTAFNWANTLRAIPIGASFYLGFTFSTNLGGEVKRGSKTLLQSIMLAVFICMITVLIGWILMQAVVGYDFMSAVAYISNAVPNSPIPIYSDAPMYLSMPIVPNPIYASVVFVAYIFEHALGLGLATTMGLSRNMFAWSFDRIAPKAFSDVNDRFHTPVKALTVVSILALFGVGVFAYASFFTSLFSGLTLYLTAQAIVGIAAMLFPYVRKKTFNAGPSIARTRIGGVPLLSIAGAITAVTMIASAVSNSVSILASPTALAGTLSLFLIGGILYYVAKAVRAREGIDISLLFLEIPPE